MSAKAGEFVDLDTEKVREKKYLDWRDDCSAEVVAYYYNIPPYGFYKAVRASKAGFTSKRIWDDFRILEEELRQKGYRVKKKRFRHIYRLEWNEFAMM